MEKSVERLQINEARLRNEVNRLERDLATTRNQLAQGEALLQTSGASTDAAHMGNSFANRQFPPASNPAEAYLSPFNDSLWDGAESFVSSSTTTLVWIETKDNQPAQMHVQQQHDTQSSSRQDGVAYKDDLLPAAHVVGSSLSTYVSQLDAVIVAMEFVLK